MVSATALAGNGGPGTSRRYSSSVKTGLSKGDNGGGGGSEGGGGREGRSGDAAAAATCEGAGPAEPAATRAVPVAASPAPSRRLRDSPVTGWHLRVHDRVA